MFTDQVKIEFIAGKGGNGIVAWRREKYIPKGGPAGGDGGKGGSVILEADSQISSLEALRYRSILKAENGVQGGSSNCRGRNGRDLIIKVPCGTLVKDLKGNILFDLTKDGEKILLCQGGQGGKGNTHFKTPTNRAPNECTPGKPGEQKKVELELKLIADVGLVGFPNAGKSTLMTEITQVPVKIAPYPFTTLRPNLGFIKDETASKRLLIADIPGIIADAHKNKGLGFEFLRHIERTQFLVFVIDVSGFEGRDPTKDFTTLKKELRLYDKALLEKPFAIVLNKMDIEGAAENIKKFRKRHSKLPIFEISAISGKGTEEFSDFLLNQAGNN